MNDDHRSRLREALPDFIGGRLEAPRAEEVRRAVEADPELQAEAELLRTLAAARADVPEGLEVRIAAAVLRERRGGMSSRAEESAARGPSDGSTGRLRDRPAVGGRASWLGAGGWVVAAAAVLVLALGTRELMDRAGAGSAGAPGTEVESLVSALESPHTPWVADDGTVGGAVVMGGLSEEALASLLEEMGG